jgi:AraC family transcriptional regulator
VTPLQGSVPVTKGSSRSLALATESFLVSQAWFSRAVTFPSHFHDRAVVGVVLDGALSIEASSRCRVCTPATLYVEPQGERHAHRIAPAGARIVSVQPDPARSDVVGPLGSALDRVDAFAHAGIAAFAERLARELAARDAVAPLAAEALALEIVTLVARTTDRLPHHGPPPYWLRRAQELVHDSLPKTIRIADLAARVDVHPAKLVRAWHRYYQRPLGDYIRRLRLEWACTQLTETDTPLSAIALGAGFADQSHFTRAFKAFTGLSPGRYRHLRK